MTGSDTGSGWQAVVACLLLFTFFLGLPVFHYVTAIMIAVVIENRAHPDQVDVLGVAGMLQRRRKPAVTAAPRSARL